MAPRAALLASAALLATAGALLLSACPASDATDTGAEPAFGTIAATLDFEGAPDVVTEARMRVSRPGRETVSVETSVQATRVLLRATGLVAGEWLVVVEGRSAAGDIVVCGYTRVPVQAGHTTSAALRLVPATSCNPVELACNDGADDDLDGQTDCDDPDCLALPCDDGDPCTTGEACAAGGCGGGSARACDDDNPCTTDTCESASGCVFTPVADGTPCADDDLCDGAETCVGGACAEGTPVTCDDGVFCNGAETCDPADGSCLAGVPPSCDDGVACTLDACDPDEDACANTPEGSRCDDGLYCDGVEVCDPALGCVAGSPPSCDDGVGCTLDTCTEAEPHCHHAPSDLACDSSDPCSSPGTCDALADCQPGPPIIDPDCPTPCGADRFEDNDLSAQATPLGEGSYADLSACPGDADWYAFDLGDNALIEVDLWFEDAEGDLSAHLYDPDLRLAAAAVSSSDNEFIDLTTSRAGIWRLAVSLEQADDLAPGNLYTLELRLGAPCVDAYEDNDAPEDAAPISPGLTEALTACPGDADYYAVSLDADQPATLTLAFDDAAGDIDAWVYAPDGSEVLFAGSHSDDERLAWTASEAGIYLLRVALNGADDAEPGVDYTLDLALGAPCTDALEDDDTRAEATPVSSGSYPDLWACPADPDWFAVDAQDNELLVFDLRFSQSTGDLDLFAFDPSGAELLSSRSHTDDERLLFTTPEAGTYWARVDLNPASGDDSVPGNAYTLEVTSGALCTDLLEDNDAREGAWPLGSGIVTGLTSCPGDEDWYAIPMQQGEAGVFEIAFSQAEGDLDLELYDPDGALVASARSHTDDERVDHSAAATGAYTLRVLPSPGEPDGGEPGTSYALTISGTAPCPALTCQSASAECGPLPDGCGRLLDCGACVAPEVCSADHRCGCVPTTCAAEAADCGALPDGCGAELSCGTCAAPELCGGAWVPNQCAEPECLADALEPNDSQADATLVSPGTSEGLIGCPGDEDWFAFDVANNETIDLSLSFVHAHGDLDLRLVAPDGREVSRSLSRTDDERVVYTAAQGGRYAARVQANAAGDDTPPGNAYTLTLALDTSCDDLFEDNDASSEAAELVAGDYPSLTACPGDVDWFAFDVRDNALIQIDAAFSQAGGDIDMRLYDPTGAQLEVALSHTDGEAIVRTAAASGTYLLRVELNGGQPDGGVPGNIYDLSVDLDAPCVDPFEDNDERLQAPIIGAGTFSGLTICPADDDWYAVDLAEGDTLTVDLSYSVADGDVDMKLFDPSGAELRYAGSNTDVETLTYTASAPGRYWILTWQDRWRADAGLPGNTYTMTISGPSPCAPSTTCASAGAECGAVHDGCGALLDCGACAAGERCGDDHRCGCVSQSCGELGADCGELSDGCGALLDCGACASASVCGGAYTDNLCEAPSCASDAMEPNDTRGEARPLTAGAYPGLIACPGDADWFALSLDANALIVLEARFDDPLGDVGLRLFDEAGRQLIVSLGHSDIERLVYTAPSAGTYYAEVEVNPSVDDRVPGNRYELGVEIGAECSDPFEDNDARSDATLLASGTYGGLTECPADEDWYAFDVQDNALIDIAVRFFDALGDINLHLYDASGGEIAGSFSQSDDESIVITAPQAGRYYLRASLSASDDLVPGNDYELTLDLDSLCTDALEDNDAFESPALLGGGLITGLTACPRDTDWYRFHALDNSLIEVDAAFSQADGDLALWLFDASGAELVFVDSHTDDEHLVYTAPQEGDFLLRIRQGSYSMDDGTAGTAYDLNLSTATLCTDAYEDNDSQAAAAPVTLGTLAALRACPRDADWYAIDLSAGQTLRVHASFLQSEGDLDLFVHNPAGSQLAISASHTDDEEIEFTAAITGTYRISASVGRFSYDGGEPGVDYSLTLELVE